MTQFIISIAIRRQLIVDSFPTNSRAILERVSWKRGQIASLVLVRFVLGIIGHFSSLTLKVSNILPGEPIIQSRSTQEMKMFIVKTEGKSCVSFTVILGILKETFLLILNKNNTRILFLWSQSLQVFISVDRLANRFVTDFCLPYYAFYQIPEEHQGFDGPFRKGQIN